jgi:hypothetical protein
MFEDSKITEARFTNNDYIDIQVLYETEADGLVEVNIEKGSNEYDELVALGWDEEKILDGTAEYKRQIMKDLNDIAVAYAKEQAKDVYKVELKKARSEVMRHHAMLKKVKQDNYLNMAMSKKLEVDLPEKVQSVNTFLNSTLDPEALEESIDKLIGFLKVVNSKKEVVDIVKSKFNKKTTATSVTGVLNKLL